MPLKISDEDITRLEVDAIVNAANTELKNYARGKGGGICGAIFRAAGHDEYGGNFGEENLLRSCYINSLKLIVEHNLHSVAFPLISSGIYGYPPQAALKVAIRAIRDFLAEKDLDVTLLVRDKSLLDSAAAIV